MRLAPLRTSSKLGSLIELAIIVVVFVLGAWAFNREAPRISENL